MVIIITYLFGEDVNCSADRLRIVCEECEDGREQSSWYSLRSVRGVIVDCKWIQRW
jgi:hypothetical protein